MSHALYQSEIIALLCDDPLPAIRWLQQKSLLKSNALCAECNLPMKLTKYSRGIDKYFWRCTNKNCTMYRKTCSIRNDSIFSKSKLSLQLWIQAMCHWCQNISEKSAHEILNVSHSPSTSRNF